MHAAVIDREQWGEACRIGVLNQLRTSVVKDQPAAIEMSGEHGMVLPDRVVADQKDAQFILRVPCLLQRDVLRNGVILAIAFGGGKRGKWRAPSVGLTMLVVVAHVSNGGVDGPVDLVQLRATGLWFDGLD